MSVSSSAKLIEDAVREGAQGEIDHKVRQAFAIFMQVFVSNGDSTQALGALKKDVLIGVMNSRLVLRALENPNALPPASELGNLTSEEKKAVRESLNRALRGAVGQILSNSLDSDPVRRMQDMATKVGANQRAFDVVMMNLEISLGGSPTA